MPNDAGKSTKGRGARLRSVPAPSGSSSSGTAPHPASTGGLLSGRMPTSPVEHTNRPGKRGG